MSKLSCPTHPTTSWVNKGQLLHSHAAKGSAERTRTPLAESPSQLSASTIASTTHLAYSGEKFSQPDDDAYSTSAFTGSGSESEDGGSENFEPGTPPSRSVGAVIGTPTPPGLAPSFFTLPVADFVPPPGLPPPAHIVIPRPCTPSAPPGLPAAGFSRAGQDCVVAPPPGLGGPPQVKVELAPPYTPQSFRRDIMGIMRTLSSHRNVAMAIREVRSRKVPKERQAAEFADILTFAMEETRGAARRSLVAFVAGLVGAFGKEECASGLQLFFDTVYPDLCDEVPKLNKLIKLELIPTLSSVLSAAEVQASFPAELLACV